MASASTINAAGKPNNALKVYLKSEVILLVLTPILLVLAITGALTSLGFAIGEAAIDMLEHLAVFF